MRDFKAKFGGDLVEFGRFHFVCMKQLYAIGKMGMKFLQTKKK